MILVHGYGVESSPVEHVEAHCPFCNCQRQLLLIVKYEYKHAYFICSFITRREYFFLCESCGEMRRGFDSDEVERLLGRVPIPFTKRCGWLITLTTVAVASSFGLLMWLF